MSETKSNPDISMVDGVASCSLCMKNCSLDLVGRECGHVVCRQCLKRRVDDDPGTNEVDDTPSNVETPSCPACREEVKDARQAHVAQLERRSTTTLNQPSFNVPPCDMCFSDNVAAERYCVDCMTLYCMGCLPEMHPENFSASHQLISMDAYFSRHLSQQCPDITDPEKDGHTIFNCKDHEGTANACLDCERAICEGCSAQHTRFHLINVNSSTSKKRKAQFESTAESCKAMKTTYKELKDQVITLQEYIQAIKQRFDGDIDAEYEQIVSVLRHWRSSQHHLVEVQADKLKTKSSHISDAIGRKTSEMEDIINQFPRILQSRHLFQQNCVHLDTAYFTKTDVDIERTKKAIQDLRDNISTYRNYTFHTFSPPTRNTAIVLRQNSNEVTTPEANDQSSTGVLRQTTPEKVVSVAVPKGNDQSSSSFSSQNASGVTTENGDEGPSSGLSQKAGGVITPKDNDEGSTNILSQNVVSVAIPRNNDQSSPSISSQNSTSALSQKAGGAIKPNNSDGTSSSMLSQNASGVTTPTNRDERSSSILTQKSSGVTTSNDGDEGSSSILTKSASETTIDNGDNGSLSGLSQNASVVAIENGDEGSPSALSQNASVVAIENGDEGSPSALSQNASGVAIENSDEGSPGGLSQNASVVAIENGDEGLPGALSQNASVVAIENGDEGLPSALSQNASVVAIENDDEGSPGGLSQNASVVAIENGDEGLPSALSQNASVVAIENDDEGSPNGLSQNASSVTTPKESVQSSPENTDQGTSSDLDSPSNRQPGREGDIWPLPSVQVPHLKFEKLKLEQPTLGPMPSDNAAIEEEGGVVRAKDESLGIKEFLAVTDGRLGTNIAYWELEFFFRVPIIGGQVFTAKEFWIFTAGVSPGPMPDSAIFGMGGRFFGASMFYDRRSDSCFFKCHNGDSLQCKYTIKKNLLSEIKNSVRFGFFLNPAYSTLALIHYRIDAVTVVHMFRRVDVSEPLIPAVQFGTLCPGGSFRIIRQMPNVSVLKKCVPLSSTLV